MAFTTIPGAGQRVRGSVLSSLFTEVRPISARKTATETVNNSSTMQDDNELFVSLAVANAVHHVEMRLRLASGTTPDFKFQFTFPASTTGLYTAVTVGAGTSVLNVFDDNMASPQTVEGGITSVLAFGLIAVGATTGTAQLQWAQNAATASDTSVLGDSYIKLTRLS